MCSNAPNSKFLLKNPSKVESVMMSSKHLLYLLIPACTGPQSWYTLDAGYPQFEDTVIKQFPLAAIWLSHCALCATENSMNSSSSCSNLETKTFITMSGFFRVSHPPSVHPLYTPVCVPRPYEYTHTRMLLSNVCTHAHQIDTPSLYTFTLMHTRTPRKRSNHKTLRCVESSPKMENFNLFRLFLFYFIIFFFFFS